MWTVVIFLGLVLAALFCRQTDYRWPERQCRGGTAYYNAQNFAAGGDTTNAGHQIGLMFGEVHRITDRALERAVLTWEVNQEEGTIDPTNDTNPAVAGACVKLGLGNTAHN